MDTYTAIKLIARPAPGPIGPELLAKLTPYVMSGKIQYRSHILEGLETAIEGLNLFFNGGNKGKLIVKL